MGAAALLIAILTFWAGPFGASPVVEAAPSLFERAADAAKGIFSERAEPAPTPIVVEPARTIDDWLVIAVAGLGGLAVVLGFAGFARREEKRPAFSAVTLGGGAILFQLVTGFILILICLMLFGGLARGGNTFGEIFGGIFETVGGIFAGIGDFFSNLFGGLFGG